MTACYKIFNTRNKLEWQNALQENNLCFADIYYSPEYYEIYQNNGDGTAQCFYFEDDGKIALYPFLINSINKLGFNLGREYYDIQGAYGYNGVIYSSMENDFIGNFHKTFNEYCFQNNIIAEFTRFNPLLDNQEFSRNNLETIYDRKTVIIDLSNSYEQIWGSEYTSNNRNMVRKAKKNNIEIIKTRGLNEILKFAELYRETMNNLNSDDYYKFSDEYFSNLHNLLATHYNLFMAYFNGNLIAGSLFLNYGKHFHYHLSARKKEFSQLAANNLIIDSAIKFAIENNFNYLHLGGGTDRKEDNTLFKFKKNFSQELKEFYIGKKVHNKVIYMQVINDWEKLYPEKAKLCPGNLLRYRI